VICSFAPTIIHSNLLLCFRLCLYSFFFHFEPESFYFSIRLEVLQNHMAVFIGQVPHEYFGSNVPWWMARFDAVPYFPVDDVTFFSGEYFKRHYLKRYLGMWKLGKQNRRREREKEKTDHFFSL
jgi:hypothetical protein